MALDQVHHTTCAALGPLQMCVISVCRVEHIRQLGIAAAHGDQQTKAITQGNNGSIVRKGTDIQVNPRHFVQRKKST